MMRTIETGDEKYKGTIWFENIRGLVCENMEDA